MTSIWRVLLAGVLMTAIVGWMIAERMLVLAQGREIVVAVQPVDPQDIFRGDYVRLTYGFTRIDAAQIDVRGLRRGDALYVSLSSRDGRYVYQSASRDRPAVEAGQILLRGTIRTSGSDAIWLDYGIESYFVPQGHGRDIEKAVGEKRTEIVLAVTDVGAVAIKALRIDGKDVYREGLF